MRRWSVWPLLMALLAVSMGGWCKPAGTAPPGEAAQREVTQGALRVTSGGTVVECPLRHTDVAAEISGFFARVTVTQTFDNPSDKPIEAIYVFPLPHTAAVDGMTMDLGDRKVVGVIKRRAEARLLYEAAVARGATASLLEQERPNIFTQSVGNIKPKRQVKIEISYLDTLKYDMGVYEFHFPMVVGPRYKPGAIGGATPVLAQGKRPGHDISLTVRLDAGVPFHDLKVENHQTDIQPFSSRAAQVTLSPRDAIPNKDFVMRYSVVDTQPQMALLAHAQDSNGYFMLMLQPRIDDSIAKAPPREFVFLVDVSGSMNGRPTEKVKEVLRTFVKFCKPEDTIQVVTFASTTAQAFATPQPATPENAALALEAIHPIRGAGGTEMRQAVQAVLAAPVDPARKRIVVMLTDGYIGNESDVIKAVSTRDTSAVKFWTLGIGMAPNRFLLAGVAKEGGGMSETIGLNTDPSDIIKQVVERMHFPQIADVKVDWGGLPVSEVFPRRVPELWAGRPVILFGRYEMGGSGAVTLSGRADGQPVAYTINVNLPFGTTDNEHAMLSKVWARQKIEDLSAQAYYADDPAVAEEETNIALGYKLMSKYTSLVAVDEEEATPEEPQPPQRVYVPVPLPDGLAFSDLLGGEEATYLSYAIRDEELPVAEKADISKHVPALKSFSGVTAAAMPTMSPPPAPKAPSSSTLTASATGGASLSYSFASTMAVDGRVVDRPVETGGSYGPTGAVTTVWASGIARLSGPTASVSPMVSTEPARDYYAMPVDGTATKSTEARFSYDEARTGGGASAGRPISSTALLAHATWRPAAADKTSYALSRASTPARERRVIRHARTGATNSEDARKTLPVQRFREAEQALREAKAMAKTGNLLGAQLRAQQACVLASATPGGDGLAVQTRTLLGSLSTRLEKDAVTRVPALGKRLELVLRNAALEDAIRQFATAAGITVTVLPGSLADATEMRAEAKLHVIYLDLRKLMAAQALDALLTPFHLSWRADKAGVTVGTARRMAGVSAWVYPVGDLAIPAQKELGKQTTTVIRKSTADFLAAARMVIGQQGDGGLWPGSAVWVAPGMLMVYGDTAAHAHIYTLLAALKDGKSDPAAGITLTPARRAALASLRSVTATRWAARAELRKVRVSNVERQQIRQASSVDPVRVFTGAAGNVPDLQALSELQYAQASSLYAEVAGADPYTATQTAWLLGEAARLQPDQPELRALAAKALAVLPAVLASRLVALQKTPADTNEYSAVLYGALACRTAGALGIETPAALAAKLADAQAALLAKNDTPALMPLQAVAAALLQPSPAADTALNAVLVKHQFGSDMPLALATLAARERGGALWETYRLEMPALMHVGPMSGQMVVALNRLAATRTVAEGGRK